ncbi:hypothetical protein SAMN04489735_100239 [Aneurinibacillus thermoaerophilus]|uniref:Uncharacterized protein n=1 Tax=Aneurinibacillus thermoaerophilus TaxID=143495 RepID=A0A1G7WPB0_ANETH|nr:hypothetical protein [Aneurinibacillus thermoaerophilus]SDG73708.1 hypothetical protein SAMN04489735_100239 [Aneurinibacillus thermoaerophilus]
MSYIYNKLDFNELADLTFLDKKGELHIKCFCYNEENEKIGVIVQQVLKNNTTKEYYLTNLQYANLKNDFYIDDLPQAATLLEQHYPFYYRFNRINGLFMFTFFDHDGNFLLHVDCTEEEKNYLIGHLL